MPGWLRRFLLEALPAFLKSLWEEWNRRGQDQQRGVDVQYDTEQASTEQMAREAEGRADEIGALSDDAARARLQRWVRS
jgi:hypothetical protein